MLEDTREEEHEEFLERIVPFGEVLSRHGPLEAKAQRKTKKYLPLLFAFKKLTEAYEVYGESLPYCLPPEARWERIREGSPLGLPSRLIRALGSLDQPNPQLRPRFQVLSHKVALTLQALHGEALALGLSEDEVGTLLAHLLERVDRGEAGLLFPRTPFPAARLMANLLRPWTTGVQILNPEAGVGELLAEGYYRILREYGLDFSGSLAAGFPRLSPGYPPPGLYAVEEDPLVAFATWANLATRGLEAIVSTRPVVTPRGFDGILVHPLQVNWRWVRKTFKLLNIKGRMVLLVDERAAGGTDPTGFRRMLVEGGWVLGALRLDPGRHGTGGVVLLLGYPQKLMAEILMGNMVRMGNPSDLEELEIAQRMTEELPFPGLVEKIPLREVAEKGYSLDPADYL